MFALFIFVCACDKPSYPKENLAESLEMLVKKDCNEDSQARIVGKTLYLDMQLDGLTSNDQAKVSEAIKKMQRAVMAITRVVLSSDSEIKYMVVSTFNEDKSVAFRILQNIEDVKGYFYMRISREDYDSRSLLEIEGPYTAKAALEDYHDISDEEYVGRLIVSQISMAARSNPFLGALISTLQLRYMNTKDGIFYILVAGTVDSKVKDFLESLVYEETNKYVKKYSLETADVRLIDQNGVLVMNIPLEQNM